MRCYRALVTDGMGRHRWPVVVAVDDADMARKIGDIYPNGVIAEANVLHDSIIHTRWGTLGRTLPPLVGFVVGASTHERRQG